MAGGRSPVNQNDALPLITVADWVGGATAKQGTINLVAGSGLTRYYTPTDLGWNDVVLPAGPAGQGWAVTPQLDLRGCNSFNLIVTRRVIAGGGDVAHSCGLYALFGNINSVFQDDTDLVGPFLSTVVKLGAANFPAYGGAFPQARLFAIDWATNSLTQGGGVVLCTTIGTNVKLALLTSNAPNANQKWTLELWGAS